MPFKIIDNDITLLHTDAIVNAANKHLQMGGGVCGAIFAAAGEKDLQDACDKIGYCKTGDAVITDGFGLFALNIIHTVGPVWSGGSSGEEDLLASCYTKSLMLAAKNNIESIAFPLISAGIFGYPKKAAMAVAVSAIKNFLEEHEMMVYLVIFDRKNFYADDDKYAYLNEYLNKIWKATAVRESKILDPPMKSNVKDARAQIRQKNDFDKSLSPQGLSLEESFSEMLTRLIDEKGCPDIEVYKRANIDQKLFLKIMSAVYYKPGKFTALALAIALRFNLEETKDLLAKAGFALSRSYKLDIIVEYFIEQENYNIYEINEALFAFGQPLLGSS